MRIFGGIDPATGKQLIPTGSAATEAEAIDMRDGFRKQIEDHTAVRTNVTLRALLAEWLAAHQVEPSTRDSYALLIDKFILPALGDQTLPALAKLGPRPYERLYSELRRCRRRCAGKPFIEHRTPRRHECDERCAEHVCRPLAASSIRQCHAVLSSAYSAAVRWGWIAFNPMESAQKPRPPAPDPDPPSSEEAARIVAAAWADDAEWGLLIWTFLVTGARRGEVLALRWENVDLAAGVLTIRHSVSEQRATATAKGTSTIKDTKTHQSRRISLDAATVALLTEHRQRVIERCLRLGTDFDEQQFLFSSEPDHSRVDRYLHDLGVTAHPDGPWSTPVRTVGGDRRGAGRAHGSLHRMATWCALRQKVLRAGSNYPARSRRGRRLPRRPRASVSKTDNRAGKSVNATRSNSTRLVACGRPPPTGRPV